MQLPFTILAQSDSWIGLLIFIIIAIASSFSKMMQKGQEPEMPEELPPRPFPPRPAPPQHRPPVVVQQPQSARRSLTEEQVQEVLRRMRKPAQQRVPPPVTETIEEAPRRMVKLSREESELPSARPETKSREVEPPAAHPEPAPHEELPPAAQPPKSAATVAGLLPRTSRYHELLRNRTEVRRAIVLRELLGPPLALRQDW
ncbi:MAG: hypothetical protein HZC54_15500 [Verrucomicrobia bacterium]|nr:hypothetical protein [Verrucomicrobiota bacterium]